MIFQKHVRPVWRACATCRNPHQQLMAAYCTHYHELSCNMSHVQSIPFQAVQMVQVWSQTGDHPCVVKSPSIQHFTKQTVHARWMFACQLCALMLTLHSLLLINASLSPHLVPSITEASHIHHESMHRKRGSQESVILVAVDGTQAASKSCILPKETELVPDLHQEEW